MPLVRALVGAAAGLLVVLLVPIAMLWRNAPDKASAKETLRLLPDLVRLAGTVARDLSMTPANTHPSR